MLKPVPFFILILTFLSLAFTSTNCKTLLAKARVLTAVDTIQLKPVSSFAINIQSDYEVEGNSLQKYSVSW